MLQIDVSDSLEGYGLLRSIAQIATYAGVLATTSLSVFDLLYRQRSDPTGTSNRYALNSAGRKRLIAFILISLFTLSSAIVKDYADRRLGASATAADKADKAKLSQVLESTKQQTELRYTQNGDLHSQIDHLATSVNEAVSHQTSTSGGGKCLKNAARIQLEQINTFLKDRLNKSPAYDRTLANDPLYSEKQVAYERRTAELYIEQFWRPVQSLIQQAASISIKPSGADEFAEPTYFPPPYWSEAMLKPGYDQLVFISEHAPTC